MICPYNPHSLRHDHHRCSKCKRRIVCGINMRDRCRTCRGKPARRIRLGRSRSKPARRNASNKRPPQRLVDKSKKRPPPSPLVSMVGVPVPDALAVIKEFDRPGATLRSLVDEAFNRGIRLRLAYEPLTPSQGTEKPPRKQSSRKRPSQKKR